MPLELTQYYLIITAIVTPNRSLFGIPISTSLNASFFMIFDDLTSWFLVILRESHQNQMYHKKSPCQNEAFFMIFGDLTLWFLVILSESLKKWNKSFHKLKNIKDHKQRIKTFNLTWWLFITSGGFSDLWWLLVIFVIKTCFIWSVMFNHDISASNWERLTPLSPQVEGCPLH